MKEILLRVWVVGSSGGETGCGFYCFFHPSFILRPSFDIRLGVIRLYFCGKGGIDVYLVALKQQLMNKDIQAYNDAQTPGNREICNVLAAEISRQLPDAENKIWHAHPVWFLEGNPIVGYSKLKNCIRLLFWSGQSFEEEGLAKEGSFKAAEVRYTAAEQINKADLKRWLGKSREVQWDYKNIVKRKGVLERLK
jgi:hypothetical protein